VLRRPGSRNGSQPTWAGNTLSRHSSTRLIQPIVEVAVRQLRERALSAEKLLAVAAWADLAGHLEQWLFRILRPTLSSKLRIVATRSKHFRSRGRVFSIGATINFSQLTLHQLFDVLPCGKESVEIVVAHWIQTQCLMLVRLQRDWDRLLSIVPESARRHIKHITPGLSDPHARGQTVTVLQFTGGERLVYKPRPCEGERIWFSALKWLTEEGFRPAFYIPKLISRRNYCWMSFVAYCACNSTESVRRFYFRWGAQAAIAQLLGCADLHRQNWIASAEQPVLVDGEMVGSAFLQRGGSNCAALSDERLHPLLRTGLLPLSENDCAGFYRGIAPFDNTSFIGEQKTFWPLYSGKVERPAKYRDQISEGFTAVLSFLRSSSREKGFHKFVVRASRRKHVRLLKRATATYYRLLDDSLQPQNMENRGQRFQYLLNRCGRDPSGMIEARSLLRCCIPRFMADRNPPRQQCAAIPILSSMLDSAELLCSRLDQQSRRQSRCHRLTARNQAHFARLR